MITVFIKKKVYLQAIFQTRRKAMLDDPYVGPFQATVLPNQTVYVDWKDEANLDPRIPIEYPKVVSTSKLLSEEGSVSKT